MGVGTNGRRRREYSGLWSSAVPQFIAVIVSLIVSLSVTYSLDANSSRHVRVHMPPVSANGPAGVSGGGPVGIGPQGIPTPKPSIGGP
jgi:hypothetical protein